MKKISFIVLAVLVSILLVACNGSNDGKTSAASGDKNITLVANESPEITKILNVVAEEVEKQGYSLENIFLTDIIQPNKVVDSKEYDANFFQHQAYLNQFNKDYGTNVQAAFQLFNVPAGLYSTKYDSIEEIPDGATIAIPIDTANIGRALFMLEDQGLIKLKEDLEVINATPKDIVENSKKLVFKEVDQQMLSRAIADVDLGFLFTSSADSAGITEDNLVVLEENEEDLAFYNLVVGVHKDNLESEKTKVLQKAFQSDRVKETLKSAFPKANILF